MGHDLGLDMWGVDLFGEEFGREEIGSDLHPWTRGQSDPVQQ